MKILVIRTDRIGDLIASTPVFESIKKAYPDSHLAAMVSPYTKDLLRYNPFVDELLVYDENGVHKSLSGLRGLAEELKEKKFDAVVTLYSKFRLGLLVYLAGIPKRIAPATKIAQVFYNHRITQRRSRSVKHEADYNLDLLKGLGIEQPVRKVGLWIDRESDLVAEEFLKQCGLQNNIPSTLTGEGQGGGESPISRPIEFSPSPPPPPVKGGGKELIGIHPGSAGSAKNWEPGRYSQLADELISKYGYSVVLSGSLKEKELLEKVSGSMKNRPAIYIPDNLLQLAAILKKVKAFVSSSTGPMHMAAALGIPTVSLFCPIKACTPVRWGPVGNRQQVLMPPDVPPCDKCIGEKCEYYDCMDMITIASAAAAVAGLAGDK